MIENENPGKKLSIRRISLRYAALFAQSALTSSDAIMYISLGEEFRLELITGTVCYVTRIHTDILVVFWFL